MKKVIAQLTSAAIGSLFCVLAQAALLDSNARFHPVISEKGMVVSQEIIASRVGAEILSAGGNAVDAAVATGFALAVTLPRAGNLGGGGFMLVHLAESGKTIAIDYREMAPAAAYRDMFLDREGEVDNQKARYSIASSGVPGTVAGLVHAQKKYGLLSLKQVMRPAINLAREGFAVNADLSDSLKSRVARLQKDPATKAYFYKPQGDFYQLGDRLIQTDLSNSLSRIAAAGRAGFYQGKTADLIVAQMQESGGLINHQDLTNYRVVERQPVCGQYRETRLCTMPPPSSGGVHLVQMLNILEGWDLRAMGHNSAAYIHRLVESMRRAYADRSLYLGDPDFFPVPVTQLTDKKYAAVLRQQINPEQSSRSDDVKPGLSDSPANPKTLKESSETTHYSTWDQWGNVVSNTYTLNFSYGSGISVAGAGFLLNNEMDDFSSKPGSPNGYGLVGGIANAIEPGKRPLSSMTPTIAFDTDGKPILATGTPGGSTIITITMQLLLNVLEFDMGIAEATAAPRIHHQWLPDRVFYESGISVDTINRLKQMGHRVSDKPRRMGATQSIQRKTGSRLFGASDYRRKGSGAVPQAE
ncbi:MAG: gamma-glutamyltransferase [Porticoccaceae bacterium]